MPKLDIGKATWDCSSTLTHHFRWNGTQRVITEGIFTSGGIRMTTSPKNQRNRRCQRIPSTPSNNISRRGWTRGNILQCEKGKVLHLTLEEMGWKQGPTTIFVDNNTASGICNSTIKRQRSRSMNGQYFWLIDQVNLNTYHIVWAPGLENLWDYLNSTWLRSEERQVLLGPQ